MESRLPKPKIGMKKQMSTVNTTAPPPSSSSSSSSSLSEMSSLKVPRLPNPSTSLKNFGKSKSGINLKASGMTKENKLPVKPTPLERSKTLATISRSNNGANSVKTAVKRPGTTSTNPSEPKRRNIRPITHAGTSNNVAVSGKSLKPATSTKVLPTKVSKWDWKGKYEIIHNDYISLKDKHKVLSEEYDKLKIDADDLSQREITAVNKIESLEAKFLDLSTELKKVNSEKIELLLQNKELQINLDNEIKIKNDSITKIDDLEKLLHQMDKDRRILHNKIQEMKGNIRVFCRVRPKIPKEMDKPMCSINYIDECTLEIARGDGLDSVTNCGGKVRPTRQEFSFDKVFPPTATQSDIFDELSMLVQSALEGYNVCVFAYGQTGSGKTYTMEGGCEPELEGMIPRTVRHIFEEMKQFQLLGWEYKIEASFLEIYNEHIVDLLDFNQKSHDIRMADTKGTDLYVTNLMVEEIESPEELHKCLIIAQENRAVAATKCNERSSRSHSVARIRLIGTHKKNQEYSVGNLNLVDLAGSERLKGDEAARQTETKNINKSLANLGNVILALLKKQDHVPYRNSKLTHLLMPSLGGNSKTLMLLNISPLDDCYNETLNSLRFASNVNSCKTGNIKRSKTMLQ